MYSKKLKELLTPYNLGFTKIRIGPSDDGGYVIYQEPLSDTSNVYSFGIGPVCESDLDLAVMGKIIHMYDIQPFNHLSHPNFIFKQVYVTSTLVDQELESVDDTNLLMCMDIEEGEYEVLTNMSEKNLLKFSQITLESHWLFGKKGEHVIKMFERLNEYFYLYHIHGNSGGLIFDGVPDVVECSYLRKDLCDKVKKENQKYPLDELDFPNHPSQTQMILNWWI
jgi:hypothetical protein